MEAAATVGWDRWVTDDGESIGMHTFGASAPQKDLYEHFGFTPENAVETGKKVVERVSART
jgi:transketolase